jgi:peptidoglycan recognition protein
VTTFSREAWGAPTPPGGNVLAGPLHRVFVHHTVGLTPQTTAEALAEVRRTYEFHRNVNGWTDIGYSWLVDDAGNAYEGRGWLRSGAHTEGHNSTSHAICWMGNSMVRRPSSSAVAAIAQLVLDGQRVGAIGPTPTIEGHRDALATACPGDLLYDQLPTIRRAVLDGDLGPATTTPPTAEEDDMTPEQDTLLRQLHFWIGQGYVAGSTVTALRPDLNAISGKIDALGAVADLTGVPTSALCAELARRAGAAA